MTPRTLTFRSVAGLRALVLGLACSLSLASGVLTPHVALAQADAVNRANALYNDVLPTLRSDTVLLPVIAKMQPVPAPFHQVGEAMLLPASTPGFDKAASWAQAAPQQAVLLALASVTKETDFRKAYAFALRYGADNVDAGLIAPGMYVELGDPPTLAAAQLRYLRGLDALESLVHVEATRRAAAGDANGAIDVLIDFAFFSRQMVDRQLFKEALWGMRALQHAYVRIRDIASVDMTSGAKTLSVDRLRAQVARLTGYLDLDRMKLPEGDRFSGTQVVNRVHGNNGSGAVDASAFASTMATLGLDGKPLRIFSEAARWRSAADGQADGATSTRLVEGIYADWRRRWAMNPFDDSLNTISTYAKLDDSKNRAILMSVPHVWDLAQWRRVNTLEQVGTRQALALVGQTYLRNVMPPTLSMLRPAWLPEISADPFNPNIAYGATPPLEYLVPPAGGLKTTIVASTPGRPAATFSVTLKNDAFVLYSVGTDLVKNGGTRIQNTPEIVRGADYIIFPTDLTLYRQYLEDAGQL